MEFQGPNATIAYEDTGDGRAALLVHGFASNRMLNWVSTSWTQTLERAGYRVIAPDLRGHGESSKFYDPDEYRPELMARDLIALMDHLALERVELMGYSMGARIAMAMAKLDPGRFRHIVLSGVGETLLNPADDADAIARSLLGQGPDAVPPGGTYRTFALKHGGDLNALAACIRGVRAPFDREAFAAIRRPMLVVAGGKDDVAGLPGPLAELNSFAEPLVIPGKDHMLTVGDPQHKRAVLAFIAEGA